MSAQTEPTTVGKITCYVNEGDVTKSKTDAVIVPVPLIHVGEGGVYEAVRRAGAIGACESLQLFHENSKNFLSFGDCLTFPAGGDGMTAFSHVSFTGSVPGRMDGDKINFAAVVHSVESALEDLNAKGLKTVSLPLMGTGKMGWLDTQQSARAMMIGVERFAQKNPDADMKVYIQVHEPKGQTQASGLIRAVVEGVVQDKASYTGISDEEILSETGRKKAEVVSQEQPHQANTPLAKALERSNPLKPTALWPQESRLMRSGR